MYEPLITTSMDEAGVDEAACIGYGKMSFRLAQKCKDLRAQLVKRGIDPSRWLTQEEQAFFGWLDGNSQPEQPNDPEPGPLIDRRSPNFGKVYRSPSSIAQSRYWAGLSPEQRRVRVMKMMKGRQRKTREALRSAFGGA